MTGARAYGRRGRAPAVFGLALSAALLGAAPLSGAQVHAAGDTEKLAELLVEMMPIGQVFDAIAAQDPAWPMQERPDAVSAEQLACLRGELSSPGYRRTKLGDARAYAEAHGSRVPADIALLEGGASMLFGQLVLAGAAPGAVGGQDASNAVLAAATPAQLLSFMTVMSDPNHAALRRAAGIGDAIDATRSEKENEKAGYQLGASLVTQLMIKSMDTCQVPTSAILG